MRRVVLLLALIAVPLTAADTPPSARGIFLGGEQVIFDANVAPHFTPRQLRETSGATRAGLASLAATKDGRALLRYLTAGAFRINVIEDLEGAAAGRAPQPGIATLVAAKDPNVIKTYSIFLNPTGFEIPPESKVLAGQPASAADLMAAAWGAELLHVDYYTRAIVLPHHQRPDFQERWHALAAQLGFPAMEHDDAAEEQQRSLRRALIDRYGRP